MSRLKDFVGDAGAFPAEDEGVAVLEGESVKRHDGVGLDQNEAALAAGGGGQEILETVAALDLREGPVIQRRALERLVRQRKAAGLHHLQGDAETGRNPDRGPQVLRDVRLIEGEAQFKGSDAQGERPSYFGARPSAKRAAACGATPLARVNGLA